MEKHLHLAIDSALEINQFLNHVIDSYESHISTWKTPKVFEQIERKEVSQSIHELSVLTHAIAHRLTEWRESTEPLVSARGFEINILNEFQVHMSTVLTFLERHKVPIQADFKQFTLAMQIIRQVSKEFNKIWS